MRCEHCGYTFRNGDDVHEIPVQLNVIRRGRKMLRTVYTMVCEACIVALNKEANAIDG